MNLIEIFSIILIHWFADFVMQTDAQAKGKSKEMYWLISHTVIYSMIWAPFILMGAYYLKYSLNVVWFIPITFIAHTITDYFTSRLNTKLWNKGDIHNFFVSIGFDQVLHYIQLFTTYYLLKG